MSRPLVFRLFGPADVVVWVSGHLAWHLDRRDGERWMPLADPPLATAGAVLTKSQVEALVQRVGVPTHYPLQRTA